MSTLLQAPYNEVTKREYRGGNILVLELSAEANDFDTSRGWAGFHQWKGAGRSIRKGEKGTRIMKFIETINEETGKKGMAPRTFVVFHFDQTTEAPTKEEK